MRCRCGHKQVYHFLTYTGQQAGCTLCLCTEFSPYDVAERIEVVPETKLDLNSEEVEEKEMGKSIINMGVGLRLTGPVDRPRDAKLVELAATIGGGKDFTINISQRDIKSSLVEFLTWIYGTKGRVIAVIDSMEFWHLYDNLLTYTGKCPFGDKFIDPNTWVASKNNDRGLDRAWLTSHCRKDRKRANKIEEKDLLEVAKDRLFAITQSEGIVVGAARPKVEVKKATPGRAIDPGVFQAAIDRVRGEAARPQQVGTNYLRGDYRYNYYAQPVPTTTTTVTDATLAEAEEHRAAETRIRAHWERARAEMLQNAGAVGRIAAQTAAGNTTAPRTLFARPEREPLTMRELDELNTIPLTDYYNQNL